MLRYRKNPWVAILALLLWAQLTTVGQAELRLGSICYIKGQAENTLMGIGLVTGLRGTGDALDSARTQQLLATVMEHNDMRFRRDMNGLLSEGQNLDTRNVALVTVTATIPRSGARQGSKLKCTVTAMSAKSLEGGRLLGTRLKSLLKGDKDLIAIAEGDIEVNDAGRPTVGVINGGTQMQTDVVTEFVQGDQVQLVLDPAHSSFQIAQDVEDAINRHPDFAGNGLIAQAVTANTINVAIPDSYQDNPVLFASSLLDVQMISPRREARVVVNQRAGTVVFSHNVEIGPVAVTNKNLVIEAGDRLVSQFVEIDSDDNTSMTSMKALLEALNMLKVPNEDVITIIREIHRAGALYGHLVESQ